MKKIILTLPLLLFSFVPILASANESPGGLGDLLYNLLFLLQGTIVFIISFGIFYGIIFMIRKYVSNAVLSTLIASLIAYGIVIVINIINPGFIDILHEDVLIKSVIPSVILFIIGYSIFFVSRGKGRYFSNTTFLALIAVIFLPVLNLFVTPTVGLIASTTNNCNLTLDKATQVQCFKNNYRNYSTPEECASIASGLDVRYLCFTRLAKLQKDINLCKAIGHGDPKTAFCRAHLAAYLKDINVCEIDTGSYETRNEKAACYYLVAKATNNRTLCEKIDRELYYSYDESISYEYEDAPLLSAYEASQLEKNGSIRDICFDSVQKQIP